MWHAAFWTKLHNRNATASEHQPCSQNPFRPSFMEDMEPGLQAFIVSAPPQPYFGTLPPTAALRFHSNLSFLWLQGWCFTARDHKAILHSKLNKQTFESVFYWFHTICHLVWGSKENCGFVGFCVDMCVCVCMCCCCWFFYFPFFL